MPSAVVAVLVAVVVEVDPVVAVVEEVLVVLLPASVLKPNRPMGAT